MEGPTTTLSRADSSAQGPTDAAPQVGRGEQGLACGASRRHRVPISRRLALGCPDEAHWPNRWIYSRSVSPLWAVPALAAMVRRPQLRDRTACSSPPCGQRGALRVNTADRLRTLVPPPYGHVVARRLGLAHFPRHPLPAQRHRRDRGVPLGLLVLRCSLRSARAARARHGMRHESDLTARPVVWGWRRPPRLARSRAAG